MRENGLVNDQQGRPQMPFDLTHKTKHARWAALLAGATLVTGCGGGSSEESTTASGDEAQPSAGLPQGSEPANLDPADFTIEIDNPYWPMQPGNRWVYRETDTTGAKEEVVVEVTDRTKMIANGVEARVVRDVVTEDGEPIEVTDDWYAQDSAGNVWYLGEDTAEYENGTVSTRKGSFEAGVDGAEAGIAMPADPAPGMEYRQEYYAGEAEDRAGVITVGQEQVQVPFGFFDSEVLMTRDLVPTEPKVQELKFFAPGVGPILSVHTDGNGGRGELVRFTDSPPLAVDQVHLGYERRARCHGQAQRRVATVDEGLLGESEDREAAAQGPVQIWLQPARNQGGPVGPGVCGEIAEDRVRLTGGRSEMDEPAHTRLPDVRVPADRRPGTADDALDQGGAERTDLGGRPGERCSIVVDSQARAPAQLRQQSGDLLGTRVVSLNVRVGLGKCPRHHTPAAGLERQGADR